MTLPNPDPNALAHSEHLRTHIANAIAQAGGWISFARYMELALYAPGLGYYCGGARKFGVGGDFVTAPELSPLFGQTIATQVTQIMAHSAPQIIEAGAGSGALAAELLLELERRDALPEHYSILELSADLRERQRERLGARAPQLAARVGWLDTLPRTFSGAVVGNELLDALPVQVVAWRPHGAAVDILERGVALDADGNLTWQERPATGALLAAARELSIGAPFISEINLAARAWVAEWGHILTRGALLLIDYGYPAREYYHAQRNTGTLMCHYRHHAHGDPFWLPGLNDVTAHVDFTAIAQAGHDAGLDVLGYASQAHFLMNCGLTDMLARCGPDDPSRYLPIAAAAQKLISPSEMGELFKAIVLGKGIDCALIGFSRGDRCHAL